MLTFKKVYVEKAADETLSFFMLRKKFLGRINMFYNKAEQAYEKKHLKAYLKGNEQFQYGTKPTQWGTKQPQMFTMAAGAEITYITEKQAKTELRRGTKFEFIQTPLSNK